MMEAKMIVAMAAQRYRLSVPADLSPGLKTRISLTPDCTIALTPVARQPHLVTQVPSGAV
jgi:hypothetical protein